jgi:hypothetical protein
MAAWRKCSRRQVTPFVGTLWNSRAENAESHVRMQFAILMECHHLIETAQAVALEPGKI